MAIPMVFLWLYIRVLKAIKVYIAGDIPKPFHITFTVFTCYDDVYLILPF